MTRHREFFQITKYARRYDKRTGKFIINVAYKTKTDITDRTIAVAEAFGLGISDFQQHVIYDNVELKVGPQDIVYVTGDSGSGKSVLLNAIVRDLNPREAARMSDVEINLERPLIDTVGRSVKEGLKLLSKVGLNDAFLFVRRYSQLSEGQKYRYQIAKLVESGAQWWIMDEFCSTLDRDTARIVAFNVQKLARKLGKAVVVATTHTDLFEDLAPNVHVHKRFGKEINVKYYPNQEWKQCSLLKEMQVQEGSFEDWKKVAGFHYRSHRVAFMQKVFILKRSEEICGAIIYTTPLATAFGRSKVFKPKNMQELNDKLTRITRVVVHPKYRTIGAGVKIVKESLPLCGKLYVETIAVMARYNPFFERAGMKKICESEPDKIITATIEQLKRLGWIPFMLSVKQYNKTMLHGKLNDVKNILRKIGYPFSRRLAGAHGNFRKKNWLVWLNKAGTDEVAAALRRLAMLNQIKVYLFWSN